MKAMLEKIDGKDIIVLEDVKIGGWISIWSDDDLKIQKKFVPDPNWPGIAVKDIIITVELPPSQPYSIFLRESEFGRRGKNITHKIIVKDNTVEVELIDISPTYYFRILG